MSVLIHEQGGLRTIYYPEDRHLRQYAELRADFNQHPDLVGLCERRERIPRWIGHLGK